jgi:hypothetical protein
MRFVASSVILGLSLSGCAGWTPDARFPRTQLCGPGAGCIPPTLPGTVPASGPEQTPGPLPHRTGTPVPDAAAGLRPLRPGGSVPVCVPGQCGSGGRSAAGGRSVRSCGRRPGPPRWGSGADGCRTGPAGVPAPGSNSGPRGGAWWCREGWRRPGEPWTGGGHGVRGMGAGAVGEGHVPGCSIVRPPGDPTGRLPPRDPGPYHRRRSRAGLSCPPFPGGPMPHGCSNPGVLARLN